MKGKDYWRTSHQNCWQITGPRRTGKDVFEAVELQGGILERTDQIKHSILRHVNPNEPLLPSRISMQSLSLSVTVQPLVVPPNVEPNPLEYQSSFQVVIAMSVWSVKLITVSVVFLS